MEKSRDPKPSVYVFFLFKKAINDVNIRFFEGEIIWQISSSSHVGCWLELLLEGGKLGDNPREDLNRTQQVEKKKL